MNKQKLKIFCFGTFIILIFILSCSDNQEKFSISESIICELPKDILGSSVTVSPDYNLIAYVAAGTGMKVWMIKPESPIKRHIVDKKGRKDREFVVVNGKKGKMYEIVGAPGVIFSPNSKHFVYTAKRDGWWYLVYDGLEKEKYKDVRVHGFSPDSKKLACIEWIRGKPRIIVNKIAQKVYPGINKSSITFSPDSKRIGYMVSDGEKSFYVIDGVEGMIYEKVWNFIFSPNSKRTAYIAKRGIHCIAVVDDIEGKKYDDIGEGTLTFSPDSQHVAFIAVSNKKWFTVIDGKESKKFDMTIKGTEHFSPNSKQFTFVGKRENKYIFLLDNNEKMECNGIFGTIFSPDSKYIAYAAKQNEKWFIVKDGVKGKEYDAIGNNSLLFSPDSKHFIYWGRRGKKWIAVVDGVESEEFDGFGGISPCFSPDSEHIAFFALKGKQCFAVVDGIKSKGFYGFLCEFYFKNSGELITLGLRNNKVIQLKINFHKPLM